MLTKNVSLQYYVNKFMFFWKNESTIEAIYDPKRNSFDLFRFVFASLVIFSHAYPLLYGRETGDFWTRFTSWQETLGGLAVKCFFTISGFLVTQSFLRSSSSKVYLIKRALRLFPALIVSSFVTAFMLGPWLSNFSLGEYYFGTFGQNPFGYFIKNSSLNLLGYSYRLRDLFLNNPYPGAVNGSLWTLKHEFVLYMLVLAMGWIGVFRQRKFLLVLTGFFILLYYMNISSGFMLWRLESPKWWAFHTAEYPHLIWLSLYFLLGSILFVWKDRLVFSWKYILLAIAIYFLAIYMKVYQYASPFATAYLVIGLGTKWKFHKFGKYGDFSYGIYIYAFPVQQTIVYLMKPILHSAILFALISLPITLVLAILSWKFVEKPALNLKRFLNT